MMKLILSLTLTWGLSGTAGALQCQTCTDVLCSSTSLSNCSSETSCVAAAIQVSSSGNQAQQIFRACAPSSLCPATGNQTYSANFGDVSAFASVQCCNTDNCNSGTVSFPGVQPTNSLRCFSCNGHTSQCTTQTQCRGVEDRCIQVNLTTGAKTTQHLGCASANLCAFAAGPLNLPLVQNFGNVTGEPSCCESSLCNGVATAHPVAPTAHPAAPTAHPAALTTATTSDTCCIRLGMIHLLLGLLIFNLC